MGLNMQEPRLYLSLKFSLKNLLENEPNKKNWGTLQEKRIAISIFSTDLWN